MAKVLVLYYSAYGHIEKMANAVAEGAREAGATVDIKRVPELVPEAVAKASHYKLDQPAPVAKIGAASVLVWACGVGAAGAGAAARAIDCQDRSSSHSRGRSVDTRIPAGTRSR